MMRKSLSAAIAVSAVLMLVATAAVAAPTVTIETPAEGAILAKTGVPSLVVGGEVTFEEPVQETQRQFLHLEECAQSPIAGNGRFLSPMDDVADPDEPCLSPVGRWTPVGALASSTANETYQPRPEAEPVTVDASRPVEGRLTVRGYPVGPGDVGVANATIELQVGRSCVGSSQMVGTTTVEYTAMPGDGPTSIPFSITPDPASDRMDWRLQLCVRITGPNALHGFTVYGGASYLDVPIWSASFNGQVELAIDGGNWSAQGVTLSEEPNEENLDEWTAELSWPAVGTHTLRARAVQGDSSFPSNVSPVVQRSFEVVD